MSGFLMDQTQKADLRWWDKKTQKEQCEALFLAFRKVENDNKGRLEDMRRFLRIYENRDYLGTGPTTYNTRRFSHGHSMLNITESVVDADAAKIAKTRPHSRFLTQAGNRSLRRKARMMGRWVEHVFTQSRVDRSRARVFKDACTVGTGILHQFVKDNKPAIERVWPGECMVDATDAHDGKPKQFYRQRWIDRDELLADHPGQAKLLRDAMPATTYTSRGRDPLTDQLEVIEAWYSGPNPRYLKCVEGVWLKGQDTDGNLPFSFFRWAETARGFWGKGLVEAMMPIHIDINRTLNQIKRNQSYGNFQVWLEQASKSKGFKISNTPGEANFYRGAQPKFATIEPIAAGLINQLNEQIARAYAFAGISQDSAAGVNSLGADAAGVARREHHERETERFSLVAEDWMHMWMDCTEQLVLIGKHLGKKYQPVAANDRYTIKVVDWDEIDLDKDFYTIKVSPVSALPSLPSAKLAHVQELLVMGVISPERAGRLLDWPDLDEEMALDRAMRDYLGNIIERMLDENERVQPTSCQDNKLALKLGQAALLKAMDDEVPDDRLQKLRDYLAHTMLLEQRAILAQQQMMAPATPGVPLGPGPTGQAPQAATPQDGTALPQ